MKFQTQPDVYLILDRVRSLYNVGSIFRTADAFGVKKIYLCGYTGTPPDPQISKVALGAEKIVPWEKRGQTWKVVEELKSNGARVVALENNCPHPSLSPRERVTCGSRSGEGCLPLHKFHPSFPIALILGNEVNGISRGVLERADEIVEIPMLGKKESLNVVVAAGIALYAVRYQ